VLIGGSFSCFVSCKTFSASSAVFNSAGVIHPEGRTRELFDVNVGGTQLVLDRARRAGVTRFVHVSSNSPFGANATPEDRFTEDSQYNPYLAYGQSKTANALFALALDARGEAHRVRAFSVHPGSIITELMRSMSDEEQREIDVVLRPRDDFDIGEILVVRKPDAALVIAGHVLARLDDVPVGGDEAVLAVVM